MVTQAAPGPGRSVKTGPIEVLHPAKDHWLVRAPLEQEDALLSALLADPPARDTLILAVSDLYAFFVIAGPQAGQILAIASPLDVDPSVFPAGAATFTEAFGQKVLVLRRGTAFEIAVERSYAPMMNDYFFRINGTP